MVQINDLMTELENTKTELNQANLENKTKQ